jgi:hypothetical protein
MGVLANVFFIGFQRCQSYPEGLLVVTRNDNPFALLVETSPTKLEDDLRALEI